MEIVKWVNRIAGVVLFYTGLSLAIDPVNVTRHLVEVGYSNWEFSRILVCALSGVSIFGSVLLFARIKPIRLGHFIFVLVTVLLTIDAILTFKAQGQTSGNLLFSARLYDGLGALNAIFPEIHLALALALLLLKGQDEIALKWYFYVLLTPLLASGMTFAPPYIQDFEVVETEVPENFDLEYIEESIADYNDRYCLVFFDPSCDHCVQTATNLAAMNTRDKMKVIAVFNDNLENIKEFYNKTGLNADYLILDPTIFVRSLEHGLPAAFVIDRSTVVSHRSGYFINYDFMDRLLAN